MRIISNILLLMVGGLLLLCGCSQRGNEFIGDWVCSETPYVGCNITKQDDLFILTWSVGDKKTHIRQP